MHAFPQELSSENECGFKVNLSMSSPMINCVRTLMHAFYACPNNVLGDIMTQETQRVPTLQRK